MKQCPSENELHELLADSLPADMRTSVEGHIEACAACQRHLDALTQAGELRLAMSHATHEGRPAFLERLQLEYPATLLATSPKTNGTLHFPGPASERAPLGQIGDFEILEELGSGSFGWVFRARERSLNRIVALKVLKPEMTARPDALVRFEREARKASLKHDHVVSVYRFEKPPGFPPYLVMEFVEGETLEARLQCDGKLTPEAAAAIARQIALGLAAAHERGMVHRDIKPANILLDKITDRAKISDFGLARDIANDSMAVTGAGELAGTAPYMSPEHFRAPETVDGRSDVFSLGIVLYQMLTSQLPFKGSFLQIRSAILEEEPASPRRLRDSIPVDLETITLACLEKDPQTRYATAQALAEDLRRFQSGEPVLCRPAGRIERTLKWMYRKPAQAALVGVASVAVLILAVLVAGLFVNAQLEAANKELAKTKDDLQGKNTELSNAKDALVEEKERVNRLKYIADINLAHQAWQNDDFRLLEQYLANYEKSPLRGFEWHYLRWLANTDDRRIGPNDAVTAVAFDPLGKHLAMGVWIEKDEKSQIQVWTTPSKTNPRGELLHTLVGPNHFVTDIAFHRSGKTLIASDRQGTICLWDLKKAQMVSTIPGNAPFAVSPDGQLLAFVRPDRAVQRWSLVTHKEIGAPLHFMDLKDAGNSSKLQRTGPRSPDLDKGKLKGSKGEELPKSRGSGAKEESSAIEQLAFSFDGKRLAAVGGHYTIGGVIAVWDLKTDQRLSFDNAQKDDLRDLLAAVAFSRDGDSIAAVGYDHALRVWDAKTGKLRFRRLAHKLEVLTVAFDSTGDLLATAGWDQTVRIWNARTGEELGSLRGNRGLVQQVAFCPSTNEEGRDHLVARNSLGELRWWDAKQEQTARLTHHDEPVHALAFSPRGRYVAAFGRNSQVLIQELVKPYQRYELPLAIPGSRGLFSHDENSLFLAGKDDTLQIWPFAKGGDAIDVPKTAHLSGPRFVARIENQWFASTAYPSAQESFQNLIPFGPDPKFTNPERQGGDNLIIAVDAAGERLAFVRKGSAIVIRRRHKQTGAVTEMTLKSDALTLVSQTVNALAFSLDGRYLAAGNQDNAILLWDTESGKLRHHLTGHLCFVSCVAFSPDGRRLVSGSEDWTVKIWDVDVGRATLTLTGHKGRIRDLAFSPDGQYLASSSEDATLRIWPGVLDTAKDRWEHRDPSVKLPAQIKRGVK
jgi:WD40 repeat protein/serine/threonine protein kinase